MKKQIIKVIEFIALIVKHRRFYLKYLFKDKKVIYKELKKNGISRIKPVSRTQWKLWYNTCYYKGVFKDGTDAVKVFIKSNSHLLSDCVNNEEIVNRYIKQSSEYLYSHSPRFIKKIIVNDHYITIYEYLKIEPAANSPELDGEIRKAVDEYTRVGILHTDFGCVNIGITEGKYCFFDYGTSLCPESNNIRLRNCKNYNHKDEATASALELIPDPDYYYDDLIHIGKQIEGIDRNEINFIIGKGETYIARLAGETIRYHLVGTPCSEKKKLLQREAE